MSRSSEQGAGSDGVAATVRTIVARRALGWEPCALTNGIGLWGVDVDLDSVALIDVICMCEDEFGVEIPASFLDRAGLTVGELTEEVGRRLSPPGGTHGYDS